MADLNADTATLLMAADLAEKGTWPVAGGWLDQTEVCVDGVRHVWGEQARWKSEQLKRG